MSESASTTRTVHHSDASIKKKSSKSRNGCLTCKKKRLKCDETKPACLKCLKKDIVCGGYATKFKWRSFNDTTESPMSVGESTPMSSTAMSQARSHDSAASSASGRSPTSFRKHLELASLSVTGKSIRDIKRENALIEEGINPSAYLHNRHSDHSKNNTRLLANLGDSSLHMDGKSPGFKRMKRSYSHSDHHSDPRTHMSRSYSATGLHREASAGSLNSLAEAAIDEINRSPAPEHHRRNTFSHPSPTINSFSPSLSDFLSPAVPVKSPMTNGDLKLHAKDVQVKNAMSSPHSDFNIHLSPSLSALINSAFGHEEDFNTSGLPDEGFKLNIPLSPLTLQTGPQHDPYEVPAATPKWHSSLEAQAITSGHESSSSANEKGSSALSPNISHSATPYSTSSSNQSLVQMSEKQQILGLYAQYTSEILSVKTGPYENPWRRLVLPLAYDYSCLYNSLAALTLFHLAGNEEFAVNKDNLRAKGYIHMKKCILELASGLSKIDPNDDLSTQLPADVAIAICLNLAVSESWDKHVSSGIAHLKGARTMISKVLALLKDSRKSLAHKRKLAIKSPEATEEYGTLVVTKKTELRKKLVLVEDSEWDNLLSPEPDTDNGSSKAEKPLEIPKSTQFLFSIWIYFEVLAQMTTDSNADEKGIDLVASITSIIHDQKKEAAGNKIQTLIGDKHDGKSPGLVSESSESTYASVDASSVNRGVNFFETFDSFSFNYDQVDPLLGCGQSLFSIMGRIAAMVGKVRRDRSKDPNVKPTHARNSLSTITAATQFRQQLLSWKPTISASMMEQSQANVGYGETDTSDLSSCIATAEAYRYSALLYLHQSVPEIPSMTSHQLAEKIFILLASIPTTSATYTTHIFPLLVASCEAEPTEEREWCAQRWEVLSKKLWIGNVDRAFEVVKEVWKRKDVYVRQKHHSNKDEAFIPTGTDREKLRDISSQMSGLMAAISSDQGGSLDDITGGIYSKIHWSSIMKEWGWEVLLG